MKVLPDIFPKMHFIARKRVYNIINITSQFYKGLFSGNNSYGYLRFVRKIDH